MSNYRRRLLAAISTEEDGYFYICHSSTGIIEKLPLIDDVYWPSLISANSIYGGLYTDWAGKGDYAKAIENGEFNNLEFVDGKLQDINYNSYNGDVSNASNRFARGKAYTSIQTPEKNKIYYICEPRIEYFDKTVRRIIYDNNHNISSLYAVTSIDSNCYSSIKIILKEVGQSESNVIDTTISGSFSDSEVTINPSYISPELQRGYVASANIASYLSQNKYYDVCFERVTLDGYKFYSSKFYISSEDMTIDNAKVQNYPFDAYYIYHTSNNTIERKRISEEPSINFPAIGGNKYGGVFTDYGGKGSIVSSESFAESFGSNSILTDSEGIPYVGENPDAETHLFDSNNAITNGTVAYVPEANTIYYIKENPEWIFHHYAQSAFSKTSPYPLNNWWLISGIDSLLYSSIICKFKLSTNEEYEIINGNVYASLKFGNTTLKASTVFRTKGCPTNTGYLLYFGDILNKLEEGHSYRLYFEAVTLDNTTIRSYYTFVYRVNSLNRNGITITNLLENNS